MGTMKPFGVYHYSTPIQNITAPREAEAGGLSRGQGQLGLHSEFKALNYIARPCLKNQLKNKIE